MTRRTIKKNLYTQLIYRPFWITITSLLVILTIALAILINTGWHALHQTEPLRVHLALTDALQDYNAKLNNQTKSLTTQDLQELHNALSITLKVSSKIISEDAKESIKIALNALHEAQKMQAIENSDVIKIVQEKTREALHAEIDVQTQLLHRLSRNNRLELETATFIAITLPILGILMLFFLRHRILRPLNNLNILVNRLGQQQPPPLPLEYVDPLLKPLFIDFNTMLRRLSELELSQRQHHKELENKVRNATRSLMEYHQTLAQSERLATVGELTAKLAHELRNPLAGIHLALANLSKEIKDEDKVARLTLVIKELERITNLLNHVLNQSRHSPEPSSKFYLADMLSSLLQLARYQIPDRITITSQVSPEIHCNLPEGGLRQALLNLILNAAQSLGKKSGTINIEAQLQKEFLTIRIQDSGLGFPLELLKNGIQAFSSSKENGTGLGLAIVKRFCHEQGGQLTLRNPPNGGACIELILPRSL